MKSKPALGALILFASAGLAQTPVGDQFQVNEITIGPQYRSSVGVAGRGDFVVVWHTYGSFTGSDSDGYSIQGRRFASDGTALGGDFQVNSLTTGDQLAPAVGVADDGDFVVVWLSYALHFGAYVHGRRYSSDGTEQGAELQVSTYQATGHSAPAVSAADDGSFVAAWTSEVVFVDGPVLQSIRARRFDAGGAALGDDFQINVETTTYHGYPAVAHAAGGDFVVVWERAPEPLFGSAGDAILARRYGSDGTPAGGELEVSTATAGFRARPDVGTDGAGNFVVTWSSDESSGTDDDGFSIQARRYSAAGVPSGSEFQVNTLTTDHQLDSVIAVGSSGDFLIAWPDASPAADGSNSSIQGQGFSASGSPSGAQFLVNSYTTGSQFFPAVARRGERIVVTWDSSGSPGDDDFASIQARRFEQTGLIFADGFESGDASAWTAIVPPP